jgi:hypothetical protein
MQQHHQLYSDKNSPFTIRPAPQQPAMMDLPNPSPAKQTLPQLSEVLSQEQQAAFNHSAQLGSAVLNNQTGFLDGKLPSDCHAPQASAEFERTPQKASHPVSECDSDIEMSDNEQIKEPLDQSKESKLLSPSEHSYHSPPKAPSPTKAEVTPAPQLPVESEEISISEEIQAHLEQMSDSYLTAREESAPIVAEEVSASI